MTRNYAERRFTCLVSDYLERALPSDVLFSHFPSGEHRTEKTGALLKRMGLKPGWPDFILVLPPHGQAAFIELKAGTGSLSKDQKAHEAASRKAGARWAECWSLDEVQTVLGAWGVQLRAMI